MNKEDFQKTKARELWEGMIANENIKSELESLDISSLDQLMQRFVRYDLDLASHPFLNEYLGSNAESMAHLKADFMPAEHLSIKVDYNGRNIFGYEVFPAPGIASSLCGVLTNSIENLLSYTCHPSLYVAASDKSHTQHLKAAETLRNYSSLSSWSQIYARFSLAAAFIGEDLVNKALSMSDCLVLEEMKEMAEAESFQDQDSV